MNLGSLLIMALLSSPPSSSPDAGMKAAPHGGSHSGPGSHGAGGHGGGKHDPHGNPADLQSYVARQESADRAEWQKPDQVVAHLAPKADQVVCDIGAGPGYFSLRLAKKARHVYAVDVEPQILSVLRERLTAAGQKNVTPVLALGDDPLLPAASCDLILIVDTFHHFPDGVAYLKRLTGALRPGGRLVNIDFHKKELPVGPGVDHKIDRADFIATARKAGLEVIDEPTFLPYQYFLVMRPAGGR